MVTWAQVRARRLARHFLTAPGPDPAAVVAAMCGAHAQILTAGELSVGIRLAGAVRAGVRAAVGETRELVKTFGPRGTVHLLPTRDLPMWTGALSAVPRPLPSFTPGVRLSTDELDRVVAAIASVLADSALTIDELDAALGDTLGGWAVQRSMPAFQELWPRWRMAVDTAAGRGVLCFGPDRDRKVTYTNPGITPLPADDALAALVRAYLWSYGPATPAHFAKWLSAPVPWATELFASLDLSPVGEWGRVCGGDTSFPAAAPRGLRLLPYFDAYGVGSHPRQLVFPGTASARALSRSQAGNYPVLLLGGVVGGVWHQKRAGRHLDVTVEPLADLSGAHRRVLDTEVDRIAAFHELTPRLTIGPVSVGPHA